MYRPALGQIQQQSLSDRLIAEIKAEAERYVEGIIGEAYEAIPEVVKRELEGEYIRRRIAEETQRAAAFVGGINPTLLLGAGAVVLFLLFGRR